MKFFAAAFLAAAAPVALADCAGVVNENPLFEGEPTLIKSTTNGKRYAVGPADQPVPLTIVQLYGSAYERGVAYGELLGEDLQAMLPATWDYFAATIDPYLQFLPEVVREKVEMGAIEAILDFYWEHTESFVPQTYKDEMQGIADGAGVDVQDVQRANMITEAIRMECSMLLADGDATSDGNLYQLRALDFSTDGPFQNWPLAAIHHPTEEGAQVHANFGFTGLVGSITGFSDASMAISEKVFDSYPLGDDDTPGRPFAFNGIPTAMLLRDIAYWDTTPDEAVARAEAANATNAIWIGVGSTNAGETYDNKVIMQYDHRYVKPFPADGSLDTWENRTYLPDTLYLGKHVQPESDNCMKDLVAEYYGEINVTTLVKYVTAIEATGDEQAAVFDFAKKQVAIAYADPITTDPQLLAYERQWTLLDMGSLFAEEQ